MSEWSEILKEVGSIYKKTQQYKYNWFRGHNDTTYSLNSGLYRIINEDRFKIAESNMFHLFTNYGDSLFDFDRSNSWNIAFCMQHYGMLTRLLDWTGSFIYALYFANMGREEGKDACVWILNPFSLNQLAKKKLGEKPAATLYSIDKLPDVCLDFANYFDGDNDIPSVALLPRKSNRRLLVQDGAFIVQGTKGIPIDVEYPELLTTKDLIKIELPWETYQESMDYLAVNGVNTFSLFPDLSGLSQYIVHDVLKYKVKGSD